MNFPLFIANRYFFSKKKKNFINVIAIISMAVVAIATAALIIALSVYNGMEGLLRSIYGSFDAELSISPAEGKSFVLTDEILKEISKVPGVENITEVIEDNVLLKYNESQKLVKMKGLSDNFIEHSNMNPYIVDGRFTFRKDSVQYAILGNGIRYALSINMQDDFYPLQFFYPKNVKPGGLDPSNYFSRANIMPGGVFRLEQHYDDEYVFVPLDFAQNLLNYGDKRTSLEITTNRAISVAEVQEQLIAVLGDDFRVLNSDQQHADLYKILRIEKLLVFLIFSLIIGIASINIFFSLSMLVIEKRRDIAVLLAMGASTHKIRRIFLSEGAIIAFVGSGVGLLLGLTIAWLQETFGLVSMGGGESLILTAYPVEIQLADFIYTALCIIMITFLASIHPAIMAPKNQSLKVQ
ncbi:FtsX-like permease family protein [Reichenbachiella sp. MALMAid0571]|uniref:FtsX-like permease family protein n=1 Tax=Reichenbachiella sp. MALMAid0571 TaxID=3143939 RepID=UPI0032DE3D3A